MLGLVKGLSPVVNAGDPILVDHRLDSGHGHNAIDVHHWVSPVDVPVARHILFVAGDPILVDHRLDSGHGHNVIPRSQPD